MTKLGVGVRRLAWIIKMKRSHYERIIPTSRISIPCRGRVRWCSCVSAKVIRSVAGLDT